MKEYVHPKPVKWLVYFAYEAGLVNRHHYARVTAKTSSAAKRAAMLTVGQTLGNYKAKITYINIIRT